MDFFVNTAPQRLATSLLHFIWQGTAIAAVYCIAAQWLLQTARARYAAGVISLALMVICVPITYVLIELPHDVGRPKSGPTDSSRRASTDLTVSTAADLSLMGSPIQPEVWAYPTKPTLDVGDKPVEVPAIESGADDASFRNELYRRIVFGWLCGVVVFALRLVAGAAGLQLLAAMASVCSPAHQQLLARLSRAMDLRRVPRLLVSGNVTEAIAAGFFRPLVVFPSAWLAELPPTVIEAVLAHELAHIRRHDLWVNLLQRTVESVLFFHPAVWWLSSQVRSERELCCDGLAVSATGERVAYVSALELVARRAAREPLFSLATGIGGRKMQLLERVRHVLGVPVRRQPGGWWAAGVLAIALPCGLWAVTGPAAPFAVAQEREGDRETDRDEEREEREREDDEQAEREGDRERDEPRERDRGDKDRGPEARRDGDRPGRESPEARRDRRDSPEARRDREDSSEVRRERDRETAYQRSEAARARAQQEAADAERNIAEQVKRQVLEHRERAQREVHRVERQMAELQQRVAEIAERTAHEIRRATQQGENERVDALRKSLEAMRTEAEDQVRKLDENRRNIEEQTRSRLDSLIQKNTAQARDQQRRAEQSYRAALESSRDQERGIQGQREMVEMIRDLRNEVQQLRREVRELRESGPRKDRPKDGDESAQGVPMLKEIPYVGRLFRMEKPAKTEERRAKASSIVHPKAKPAEFELEFSVKPEPKVSIEFSDDKAIDNQIELEFNLEQEEIKESEKKQTPNKALDKSQIHFNKAAAQFADEAAKLEQQKVKKLIEQENQKLGEQKVKELINLKNKEMDDLKVKANIELKNKKLDDLNVNDLFAAKIKAAEEATNKELTTLKAKLAEVLKDKDKALLESKLDKAKADQAELQTQITKDIASRPKVADDGLKQVRKKFDEEQPKSIEKQATDDIDIRYAQKAAEVNKAELDRVLEANKRVPHTVSDLDVNRLQLQYEKALLEVEKARRAHEERRVKAGKPAGDGADATKK